MLVNTTCRSKGSKQAKSHVIENTAVNAIGMSAHVKARSWLVNCYGHAKHEEIIHFVDILTPGRFQV